MSMDKRWQETFTRLDGIEEQLAKLNSNEPIEAVLEVTHTPITKEQLMSIKGVGSSTADAILELLNA